MQLRLEFEIQFLQKSQLSNFLALHTEKCLVEFRWLIQLHDLVCYRATTYLVVETNSDSCIDLGNATIWWVTLPVMIK